MALSGSFYGSILNGHYKLRVDWSATQNVANNTSKITAVLYLVNDWSLAISGRSDNSASIAGTASTWASPAINGTGTTKLATVTSGNITHSADGTKSVTISATYNIRATINGTYYDKITASATVALNTIPRATTPTFHASSVDMGRTLTIYTSRASESFTHDLAYSFAGSAFQTFATDVGTWYAWAVPDLATSIPNAISGTMTIRCITKNGGTTVGTTTALVTVKVPASVVPTIKSITCEEATSNLVGKFEAYVQGYSTVKTTISAEGAKGSTIKSYSATLEGKTYTGSDWTSSAIQGHTTVSLVVTVTDSRGRTTQETKDLAVMGYTRPQIQALSCYRCNANGAAKNDGEYIAVRYKYSVTELGGRNEVAMRVYYKKANTDDEYAELISGTALSADTTEKLSGPTFSTDYQYTLKMELMDWFAVASPTYATLPSGAVILDLMADGSGISFGETAESSGVNFGWSPKGAVLGLREATATIPGGGDLNDYLAPGVYAFHNTDGRTANCPIKTNGLLRVWSALGQEQTDGANTYLMQEVIPYLNNTPTYRRAVYSYPTAERTYAGWTETTLNGQRIIWTGTYLMQDGQSITIPSVSEQSTGIVLIFSRINGTTVQNANFHAFFVPKEVVRSGTSSYGLNFVMATSNFGVVCNKLLFIGDTKISGYVSNNATGTGDSGIKYNNAGFVLRYVLGV